MILVVYIILLLIFVFVVNFYILWCFFINFICKCMVLLGNIGCLNCVLLIVVNKYSLLLLWFLIVLKFNKLVV